MIIGFFCTVMVILTFSRIFKEVVRQKIAPPELRYNGPVPPPGISGNDIIIDGKHWQIEPAEIASILQKRYPYYRALNAQLQARFVRRTSRFIKTKVFIIKSDTGFREMPVLSSAAAIHLTFGLSDFLLPWFRYIQIYPEEFLSRHAFRILAGNVSSHTISIAWNHLLTGNNCTSDSCNVALHEMSHALFYQKIEVEGWDAYKFREAYVKLMGLCKEAYHLEHQGRHDVYSEYAMTNLQEFWAESIKLFFEKPQELKAIYPDVFNQLVHLLKQNPLQTQSPIL